MTEWPLIGNRHITKYLDRSIVNKKISNAYVFNGADDLGKTTLARFFAKLLLCSHSEKAPCGNCPSCRTFSNSESVHPDFHLIKRDAEKKNISIAQIRGFIRSMNMSPFVSRKKVGIIKHAETLSIEAFNALLKTLEEALSDVVIILVVNEMELMPDTVRSRCQILNFKAVAFDDIYNYLINAKDVSRNSARDYAKICLGRPALALKFLQDQDFYKKYIERVEIFLEFFKVDLNIRFAKIDFLLENSSGQAAVKKSGRVLNVWSGVLRDLLLLSQNNTKSIQHQLVVDKVREGTFIIPDNDSLLMIYKRLKQAEDFLNNNVNPKLALEGVAMGIK